MALTIGSLFSGIGGLELGLERAGLGPVVFQAESDPYCRRVLAKHWPEATRYEDVRDIDDRAQRPDVICGGFPCQDISNAGKRAGMAGERSGLWGEFARIIRELRPRFVVVENVSALLGRGLGDVLGDLAACGYDAQWDCIPAAAIGAPHRRDRVFVIAWRVSDTDSSGRKGRSEVQQGQSSIVGRGGSLVDAHRQRLEGRGRNLDDAAGRRQSTHTDQAVANPNRCRLAGRTRVSDVRWQAAADAERCSGRGAAASEGVRPPVEWPPAPDDMQSWGRVQAAAQPALCGVAHGIPARAHRLRAIGNAVVPQVAGRIVLARAA